MERVENTRQEILNIITSRKLTHEQKLTNLAGQADSLLEVLAKMVKNMCWSWDAM